MNFSANQQFSNFELLLEAAQMMLDETASNAVDVSSVNQASDSTMTAKTDFNCTQDYADRSFLRRPLQNITNSDVSTLSARSGQTSVFGKQPPSIGGLDSTQAIMKRTRAGVLVTSFGSNESQDTTKGRIDTPNQSLNVTQNSQLKRTRAGVLVTSLNSSCRSNGREPRPKQLSFISSPIKVPKLIVSYPTPTSLHADTNTSESESGSFGRRKLSSIRRDGLSNERNMTQRTGTLLLKQNELAAQEGNVTIRSPLTTSSPVRRELRGDDSFGNLTAISKKNSVFDEPTFEDSEQEDEDGEDNADEAENDLEVDVESDGEETPYVIHVSLVEQYFMPYINQSLFDDHDPLEMDPLLIDPLEMDPLRMDRSIAESVKVSEAVRVTKEHQSKNEDHTIVPSGETTKALSVPAGDYRDLNIDAIKRKQKKQTTSNRELREKGMEYLRRNGTIAPARQLKPPCYCKKLKCHETYSDEMRALFLKNFLKLTSSAQNQFLSNHVLIKLVAYHNMADALKLADMQRASVEFERQRHLANWLIESSPHMPMVTPQQQQKQAQQLAKKGAGKGFKQNPIFFLAKIGHNMNLTGSANAAAAAAPGPPPNLLSTNSIASTFNSQTNLPLAIVSSSGRDGHKPKLRRFNSHDTSANMFSVAEFENARMARRNEIENAALLRQRQRYKLNSLSSGGGDCSTGESKGSKLSNDSTGEPLFAEHFLEKFSLPRVVRVSYTSDSGVGSSSSGDQTMTSSSSAESTSTSERKKKKKSATCNSPAIGELFLLYRYMRNYKVYHVFNSKSGSNRKKGYKIPQDYPGYFSFLTEKGTQAATVYTTIVQLVRERVYKFLSLENLSAYTESHDNYSHKTHYVKATAKAGQVYRLLAVFQDGDQQHKSSSSSQKDSVSLNGSSSGADKERGKYAQLLGDNRQIYYVSLSAKGKFYEIEQHTAPVLQKSSSLGHPNSTSKTPKQLNRECVHRIGFIMQSEVKLPLQLKLIASMAGSGNQSNVPEYITIAKISMENFTVACPIDEQEYASSLTLTKLHTTSQLKFTKCSLGFDSEQRMFLNAAIQTVLKFCQFNCDNFTRVVDNDANWAELQQLMNAVQQQQQSSANSLNHLAAGSSGGTVTKSEMLKKLKLTRLFGSGGERNQGSSSGHEKEDSIIFLSKNDLESLECGQQQQQLPEHDQQPMSLASGMSDRMKVFTPSKKKWFKGLRLSQEVDEENEQEKRQSSIDRYKDMSRLIQERFGDIDISGVPRANSDIGYDDSVSGNPGEIVERESGLQKCLSLQHIELKTDSGMDIRNKDKPDLVNNISLSEREDVLSESEDTIFFPIRSSATQQSFMTQKLYSEFHVKTKQHSKSQSSIQHLLNLASPQKVNEGKNKSRDKKRSEIVLSFEDLQSLNRDEDLAEGSSSQRNQLSILDDLPYSSVRDSIVLQESEPRTPPSESIYAEICAETPTIAAPPPRPEKRFTSIRINVPSSDAVSHNPAGSRCAAAVVSPVEDNIYNTIK